MSNIVLYCKVQNVIMSCRTEEQLTIAKNYVRLAERVLPDWWCMEVIQLVLVKEMEIFSR